DRVMSGAERGALGRRREQLLTGLGGHVVEVGAGTGINLRHLDSRPERVTALEPNPAMSRRLRATAALRDDLDIEVLDAPVEALPLPDTCADTVISTLVLCSVDDLDLAITEIRRVLRDDGRLVVLEHVASHHPVAAAFQRAIEPAWTVVARGCRLTRDTRTALADHGFAADRLDAWRMPGAGPAAPAISGITVKR
ncbi:MAG: class I SAM-dependent methyltransferase, partial [Actinomycetota bacterium]